MRKLSIIPFLFSPIFLLTACKTIYQPATVQYTDYRINTKQGGDTAMLSLLSPYTDSVNKNMNDVIAVSDIELEKKQPEGTLNNILADAMLDVAKEKYAADVDAAFINYGGIRLNTMAAGNITRGKIFEVAPFDNIIVLLKLPGNTLQQFLDITASRGGWPCSGISYRIENKKAVQVLIQGKPINTTSAYTIALLDYVANGGDDCNMLKLIPQQNKGYLFRDAVISYFSKFQRQGKSVHAQHENRVTNVAQ